MGRIAFGSPEAQAVLAKDKKAESERHLPTKVWQVTLTLTGESVIEVAAKTSEEACRIASREYDEGEVSTRLDGVKSVKEIGIA